MIQYMLHLPVMDIFRGVSVTVWEERDSEEVRISDDDTQISSRVILLKGWPKYLKYYKTNDIK